METKSEILFISSDKKGNIEYSLPLSISEALSRSNLLGFSTEAEAIQHIVSSNKWELKILHPIDIVILKEFRQKVVKFIQNHDYIKN